MRVEYPKNGELHWQVNHQIPVALAELFKRIEALEAEVQTLTKQLNED